MRLIFRVITNGLSLKCMEDINEKTLTKLAWRVISNPASLLAEVLVAKYARKTS